MSAPASGRPQPRVPSFGTAVARVFDLSLGEMLWSRRTIFMALVVGGPVLLALIAAFIAQNYETVEVRILTWSTDMRLAWTLLLATVFGIAIGWLLPRRWR